MTQSRDPIVVREGGGGSGLAVAAVAIVVLVIIGVLAVLVFAGGNIFNSNNGGSNPSNNTQPTSAPAATDMPLPTLAPPASQILPFYNLSGSPTLTLTS